MLELRSLVLALGLCGVCAVSGPAVAEQTVQTAGYFCNAEPDELVSIEDAVAATRYFRSLREGMVEIELSSCTAPWISMGETLASLSDETEKAAFVAGVVRSQMSASVHSDTSAERYARDTHILLLAARVCILGDTDPAGCIKRAISSLPEEFTVSSPVFCDFSAASFASGTGQGAGSHELPDSLPFLCSTLSERGTVETGAQYAWLSSAAIWLSLEIED